MHKAADPWDAMRMTVGVVCYKLLLLDFVSLFVICHCCLLVCLLYVGFFQRRNESSISNKLHKRGRTPESEASWLESARSEDDGF